MSDAWCRCRQAYMALETEPLTSLLIRETTIAAQAAGKLSGALWQISRVLRKHLQPEMDYDKMTINKGKSGEAKRTLPTQSSLFPSVDPRSDEEMPS